MTEFENSRIPPPQAPIPPHIEQVENRYLKERSARERRIEELVEELEAFILKSSKDSKQYHGTFQHLTTIRNISYHNLLNADEENSLEKELLDLKEGLNGNSLKISHLEEKLDNILKHFEEIAPKISILKEIELFKLSLSFEPPGGLPPMAEEEFGQMMETFYQMLKSDLTKFQAVTTSKKLHEIHTSFIENPRTAIGTLIQQIQYLSQEVQKNSD